MEVNRKELLDVLAIPAKVAQRNSNPPSPAWSYLHFDKSVVVATDGTVWIERTLPGDLELSCAVPARTMYEVIRSYKDKMISIEQEQDKVVVSTETGKSRFVGLDDTDVVVLPSQGDDGTWHEDVPMHLVGGILGCRFTAAKSSLHDICNGIYVINDQVMSTDRYRACRYWLDKPVDFEIILPLAFSEVLAAAAHEIWAYCIEPGRFLVKLPKDGILMTSLLDGHYPDLSKVFPDPSDAMTLPKIEFDHSISDVVSRATAMQRDTAAFDRELEFHVEGDLCRLACTQEGAGDIKETVALKEPWRGEPLTFSVNPQFLEEFTTDTIYWCPDRNMVCIVEELFEYILKTRGTD